MRVLHALWDSAVSGKLHLWAECSDLVATASQHRRKSKNLRQHPFVVNSSEVRQTVSSIVGCQVGEDAEQDTIALLFPADKSGPLPSRWVISGNCAPRRATGLAPWNVAVLSLHPGIAFDFLLSIPAQPPRGLGFSNSLCFWSEVAKFSLELITRQCFIPTLRQGRPDDASSFRATWEASLADEDAERMHLLSRAMPPCCWAFFSSEGERPLPANLIAGFLNQTMDAFIRRNLVSNPLPLHPVASQNMSLPAQWLKALSSADQELSASITEITSFSSQLNSWLGQLRPPDTPFRTCFRLDPPSYQDSQHWQVIFYLQANDDRSLLIPAEKVWQTRSGVLTFLKRRFESPQERLLADLGRASRLFPAIEQSLNTAHPVGLELDTNQAYAFLRQSAPLLEQSGFGVLLPPWWQRPAARLSIKLKVKPKAETKAAGLGLLGMDSIVAYDWKIAIGEETISAEEFKKLADLKVPLVQVRGQWVELKPEEVEKAIAFFQKKHGEVKMRLSEALQLGLGKESSAIGLPVMGVEAEGWVEDLLNQFSGSIRITTMATPPNFNGKLRPYQVKGFSWLIFLQQYKLGACLADDMGLGKTVQLIALLLHQRLHQQGKSRLKPTLVICPMSVAGNWHKELQRFAPSLKVMVHHGAERLSGKEFEKEVKRQDVVISTYALAHRDETLLSLIHWGGVVLDEAQNIKNPSARQAQAVKRLTADHRIALTGTPVENRLSELWSIMDFLNPGYLKSIEEFRTTFALPVEKYHDTTRADTLKRLIQPFVLRRLKTDTTIINDLPEKMEMKVFCNISREQASLYEAVVKEMLQRIENSAGIERKGLVLATLTRLKQVCNHPAQFLQDGSIVSGRSGKLNRLMEMTEEMLSEGDKALVFTQFAEMGAMLCQHLRETLGCEVLFLHGGTPKKQRDLMVSRFQEGQNALPLFILSLKAGGLGLNLTAANHVFHYDRWWNPAVENQATDRAYRIGQRRNVQIHKFICTGTLEERIDQMIEQKKELADRIIGSGESWITELSTDQLKEIFTLRREAVAEE